MSVTSFVKYEFSGSSASHYFVHVCETGLWAKHEICLAPSTFVRRRSLSSHGRWLVETSLFIEHTKTYNPQHVRIAARCAWRSRWFCHARKTCAGSDSLRGTWGTWTWILGRRCQVLGGFVAQLLGIVYLWRDLARTVMMDKML